MDNRETVQETEEAIGKVGVPPVGGVFSQPWSMNKVFGLLAVFGSCRDCGIGQHRCR